MPNQREIVIGELPKGELLPSHFQLRQMQPRPLAEGEIRIRNILMSIDAANRAWMQGATYRDPVGVGDPMPTYAIGQVIESRSLSFAAGDLVSCDSVWADEAVVSTRRARKLARNGPLSHRLSVLGIAGKTAYHGLLGVGRPVPGETVVVSAAAGSVGMYVGQIARAKGCRAIGIAGGADKCRWVVDALGFDACIDYRDEEFFANLKAACPQGIDVYFDNVGGRVLESVLFQMNERGRVVCCGAVSQYDAAKPTGPRNVPGLIVVKRLRMEGFIVMDFADQDEEAERELRGWLAGGDLVVEEDIVEGLENAPRALVGLLAGDNRGKRMVRVAPDPV